MQERFYGTLQFIENSSIRALHSFRKKNYVRSGHVAYEEIFQEHFST